MNKRGIVSKYILAILIALALILLISLSISAMRESGFDWIDKIQEVFKGLG